MRRDSANTGLVQILSLAAFAAAVLSFAGCRTTSSEPPTAEDLLNDPTVFIAAGLLSGPRGVAVDSNGEVWVADTRNNTIRRYSPSGTQRDSVTGFTAPAYMTYDQFANNILVVVGGTTIVSINPQTNNAIIQASLTSISIDGSAVLNINTGLIQNKTISPDAVGDVAATPNGDIYVNILANGSDNYLLRIRSGFATAIAFSSQIPTVPADAGPRFVVADAFGSVYTTFVLGNGATSFGARVYVVNPSNPNLSHAFTQVAISGGARGAGIDPSGYIYVAETPLQELVIVSSRNERTIDIKTMPNVAGISQAAPRDVAVAPNGDVYVTVADLFPNPNEPGAVLKYTRK